MNREIFKKGDKVFDISYGWGEVVRIDLSNKYPIEVKFIKITATYLLEGVEYLGINISLSFTEYTLEGFSQERPITFEKGGMVWFKDELDTAWYVGRFYSIEGDIFKIEQQSGDVCNWEQCRHFDDNPLLD